jgi:beta-N-acetylhexosaminidase
MFVMVSNVTFPGLDSSMPACVSKPIMTDILRDQLHYEGLIVSDDMEMGAMAKHYAFADMGVMAIRAGADMVLVCHDYNHEQETYNGLLKTYQSDSDFRKLVDEKVLHILRVKLAE